MMYYQQTGYKIELYEDSCTSEDDPRDENDHKFYEYNRSDDSDASDTESDTEECFNCEGNNTSDA